MSLKITIVVLALSGTLNKKHHDVQASCIPILRDIKFDIDYYKNTHLPAD
jgi:hypothetical protein